MTDHEKARLKWVQLYEKGKSISYISRHCGISRPTIHKWIKRNKAFWVEGLSDQSKRPKNSPNKKLNPELEALIFDFREDRNLGTRRIQNELLRLHGKRLVLVTIHKVLKKHQVEPIVKTKLNKSFIRYQKDTPIMTRNTTCSGQVQLITSLLLI